MLQQSTSTGLIFGLVLESTVSSICMSHNLSCANPWIVRDVPENAEPFSVWPSSHSVRSSFVELHNLQTSRGGGATPSRREINRRCCLGRASYCPGQSKDVKTILKSPSSALQIDCQVRLRLHRKSPPMSSKPGRTRQVGTGILS